MAKRKAHIVLYETTDGDVLIDSVYGKSSMADSRINFLEDMKWIKRAWTPATEMNTEWLDIPIRSTGPVEVS